MIDHVSLAVRDIERSRAFYDAVLATLDHRRTGDIDGEEHVASGWGPGDPQREPGFWVGAATADGPAPVVPEGQHVAFTAPSRAAVDAFYRAALAAGGRDNGPPGLRPHYHPDYYACFVIDPDGHHLEAVCHRPA